MPQLALTCLLLLAGRFAEAAYCNGAPDPNAPPNALPILARKPTFVRSVENGKLYSAGPEDNAFHVVHVFGTPYEMGLAQARLYPEVVASFYKEVWEYMQGQIEDYLKWLPQKVRDAISNWTIEKVLDWQERQSAPYISQYFLDEMKGLAEGAGVDFKLVLRVHMLPELTKGHCSMFGAWGGATEGGKTLQLRALDWDTDGPFKRHSAVVVYHPTGEDSGHAFANIGFTGFIGAVTGISSKQMAISEIGVTYPDDSFGKESRKGTPFVFLLRDVLQFDESLLGDGGQGGAKNDGGAVEHIQSANRTCNLILGVGDGKEGAFRSFQYSASVASAFDDTNMMPDNQTWHPRIDDVVYYGMDWLCPGYSLPLAEQLKAHHGNLSAAVAISDVVARTQTGNLHIAVYDLTDMYLYVSFHRKEDDEGEGEDKSKDAYAQQYTRLDAASLFEEAPPAANRAA